MGRQGGGCRLLLAGRRMKKENEREGKKGGGYIRGEMIITILPFPLNETCVSFKKWVASHSTETRG